jgi:hypothetical protein
MINFRDLAGANGLYGAYSVLHNLGWIRRLSPLKGYEVYMHTLDVLDRKQREAQRLFDDYDAQKIQLVFEIFASGVWTTKEINEALGVTYEY